MNNLISIDPGNFLTKVITKDAATIFSSGVCEINSTDELDGKHLEHDFKAHTNLVMIQNKMYVVGQYASKMLRTKKLKKDKATTESYVRILTQVAKFVKETNEKNIILTTLNPIGSTKKKDEIRGHLQGEHTVILDGVEIYFYIEAVHVFNEGATGTFAFEDAIHVENFTVMDVGSSTINVADFYDFEYIHRNSETIPVGVETFRSKLNKQVNYNELVAYVEEKIDELAPMKERIYLITGDMSLIDRLEVNEKVVYPTIEHNGKRINTTFANCLGAYIVAKDFEG